jgi:hypothetical protein
VLSLFPPHRQYAVLLDGRVLATADTRDEAMVYMALAFAGCVGLWRNLRTLRVVDRHGETTAGEE